MATQKCRVCDGAFFDESLLRYENMPKAAQYLPDAESLASDKGVDIEICQCSGCGLVQLSNDPVPYFKEVIRASGFSPEMGDFRSRQFTQFVEQHALKGRKVIEIGCGQGEYLSIMQQTGVDAYGLEYSAESVKQCIKNGLKVTKGFVQSHVDRIAGSPFDAFCMMSYLEHLPDPNSTLGGIKHNLAEGAVGLVEVPNFDMIINKKLFAEFIGDHLFYFTRDTLSTTLKNNGFDILECNAVWHDYILSAVIRKSPLLTSKAEALRVAEKLDLSGFKDQQERIITEIEEYLDRFQGKKVVIWGAGHQALAVISLANLAGKIEYVVDSATFKQGKYTPATHVPIVSPDAFNADSVDAVIVMAASYSDEVTKIVRQKYGKKIDMVILRDSGLEAA